MNIFLLKNIRLPKIANTHPLAFWSAVILHIALVVGLLIVQPQQWKMPEPTDKAKPVMPQAITIDLSVIKKEKQRLIAQDKQRKLALENQEKRLKESKRQEKKVENERYKEQQRLKKLKKETKEEKKKNKEEKKKTKKAEKKTKEADEKTKKAEKKAIAAEKDKQRIEKQRDAKFKAFTDEQKARALTKEIQREEDQDRTLAKEDLLSDLSHSYINQIAARVRDHWRYQGAQDNWGCDVSILQDIDGTVQKVNLSKCNVDSSAEAKAFKDSVERAVYKASPLPHAPDKSVFEREILFHFKVN